MAIFIRLIQAIGQILTLLVLVDTLLSYFMSPFHPFRMALDRVVQPMLNPIRRVVPPLMMLDFSPIILILLIQGIEALLVNLLA
jgi:YggT family protein